MNFGHGVVNIPGYIEVTEQDAVAVAAVRFPSIGVEFFVGCRNEEELRRGIMRMVADAEQVRGIQQRTGRLDWEAMEAACRLAPGPDIWRRDGVDVVNEWLAWLAVIEQPPDVRDDLVSGVRIVGDIMRESNCPASVRERCGEWLAAANRILRSAK